MKTQLTIVVSIVLAFLVFTAPAQQKEEKGKGQQKKEQTNQGKGQDKQEKGNQGKSNKDIKPGKPDQDRGNADGDNRGQGKDKDRGQGNDNANNRKNEVGNAGGKGKDDDFDWTPETFRDRNKIRNAEKVTLCHKFNNGDEPAVTIRVSSNAMKAHMNHGDVMGECPTISDNRFSDNYLRRRTDYYNLLQDSNEEIIYSRSILDYALARLANARQQLTLMQNNNMPVADIQRRQVVVTELEQNVSVLEQLIGVAANLVVNKLMN